MSIPAQQIRLFKPSVGEEEIAAIGEVFELAWLGLAAKFSQFEQAWSAYLGCRETVATNAATAALHLALYVPAGCAHGFIARKDASEVSCLMGEADDPALARRVRRNDPQFGIRWPIEPMVI